MTGTMQQRLNVIITAMQAHAKELGALFNEAEELLVDAARAAYVRGGVQRQEEVNNALGRDRLAMDLGFVLAAAGLGAVVADPTIARAVMSTSAGETAQVAAAFAGKWKARIAQHV